MIDIETLKKMNQPEKIALTILGSTVNQRFVHIVVSNDTDYIYLITAYYPDTEQWEADFKTRKGR